MALNTALRYYRGQFDPENAYQQQPNNDGVISMYNPQAEAQFFEAVAKRQERFDTTNLALQQERIRIGETETYDLKELNKRLKSFEGGINDLVQTKYNGDYGAAANEIAKMIGTERTNPFYHFNKQKVEMGKSYLDAKMKLGANFIESSSPFDVSFEGWQQGQTFEFTPLDKRDITQASAMVFSTLADSIRNVPEPQMTQDQRFMQQILQRGFRSPEEVRNFITKDPAGIAMYQQVKESMPELANAKDQGAVDDALIQGAYKAIGRTEVQTMQNPDYIDAYQRAQLGAKDKGMGNIIVDAGILNNEQLAKEIKEEDSVLNIAYKNDLIPELLKDPKYASLRGRINNMEDVGNVSALGIIGRAGRAYTGGASLSETEKQQLDPVLIDLNSELDRRSNEYFAGRAKGNKGEPIGMRSYKIVDVFPGMNTQTINEVNKIQDQFEMALKPYMIGEKLPPNTSFIGKQSKRDASNIDGTQKMTITNISLSPYSKHVVFGISGFSKDKKRLESKIAIDLGDNPDPNISQALATYKWLAGEDSDFTKTFYAWLDKFYSK
jgi:hypothetical protein